MTESVEKWHTINPVKSVKTMMLQAVVFPSILMIQTVISYINLCFSVLYKKNEIIQGDNLPKIEKIQGNNLAKIEKIQGNNFLLSDEMH